MRVRNSYRDLYSALAFLQQPDCDVGGMRLLDEELKRFYRKVYALKKKGARIINSYGYIKQMINCGLYKGKCYCGKSSVVVNPDGSYARCYKYLHTSSNPECDVCEYTCHIEENRLFGLKFDSISNLLRFNKW